MRYEINENSTIALLFNYFLVSEIPIGHKTFNLGELIKFEFYSYIRNAHTIDYSIWKPIVWAYRTDHLFPMLPLK